jgi:hypothetical protein
VNQQWTNRPVVDHRMQKVGTVTDVIFGDVGDTPEWATVKTGLLAERLAPLQGAYVSEEGTIVLPFDQDMVKHAPKPPRNHVLSDSDTEDAIRHYEMA